MKKLFIILIATFNIAATLYAQTLQVVDAGNRKGIFNVSVYSKDKNIFRQTDSHGQVDFAPFSQEDTLYFQHPGYQQQWMTDEQLRQRNYTIALEEKVIQMEEALILVNRWEQSKNKIPHHIVSVMPSAIAFRNPQTAADALENTGQVFVQKSQLGGGSPMIRGFAANSVLIVVDGIRMNNAIFRSGNLQNVISIDPALIGEAEVIFGPGSVIYGSDALGGVMDFHTRQPVFSSNDKVRWSSDMFVRHSSANQEKTGHAEVSWGTHRWASLSSFTYSDFGDLRAGGRRPEKYPNFGKRLNYVVHREGEDSLVENNNVNRQVPSGYRQWNLMQKIRFRPVDAVSFTYGFIYSNTSDIPRYDRLIVYDETDLPENAAWYYGPQKWMMHYGKINLINKNNWYDEMKITVAYQAMEESRHDRSFGSQQLRSRTEKVGAYTLNADADKVLGDDRHLFYGIEGVFNDISSQAHRTDIGTSERTPASTRYPDGGSTYGSAAVYLNHQWDVNETSTFHMGVRYSRIWLRSLFEDKTFYNFPFDEIQVHTGALSGSTGLVYRPNDTWKISGMLSSGFRAPNVDDVGKVFDSEPGSVVVPNPGLGPEYSYNAELGITKILLDKIEIYGVAYYSLLRDAMVRRDFTFNGQDSLVYDGELSRVQALVNVGRAYIWGLSFNAAASLSDSWTVRSSVSYNTGRDNEENIPLRHTTPLFGRTSVAYQHEKWRGEFYVSYHGSRSYEDLPPSERSEIYLYTPEGALAWYTLNLMGSFQINENLQAQVGMENILDKHYRPYSSGISAPGRNLILTLRATL